MKLWVTIVCVLVVAGMGVGGTLILTGSQSTRQAAGHFDPHWTHKPLSEVWYSPSRS